MAEAILQTRSLSVRAGPRMLLQDVTLSIPEREVFGIIGPSGAGKSTLLRCLNRLVELSPGLSVSGEVAFHGAPIYSPEVDADALRARIGMLFQQPVVFPRSIYQNVIFGMKHLGRVPRSGWKAAAEQALCDAALWDEVKDRLHHPAKCLSVGQQQRLCLARTLATGPEVILMDEPTSALDPRSAESIEQLIHQLKASCTLVLVTHNLDQLRRLANTAARIETRSGIGTITSIGPPTAVAKSQADLGE